MMLGLAFNRLFCFTQRAPKSVKVGDFATTVLELKQWKKWHFTDIFWLEYVEVNRKTFKSA